MKKFLLVVLLLLIAGFAIWKFAFKGKRNIMDGGTKLTALTVSQHSVEFNESMQAMLTAYYDMTNAFVAWDSIQIREKAELLGQRLDSLKIQEMEKDSLIYPTVQFQWEAVKAEVDGLLHEEGWEGKRASLNMLSQQLYDLLRIVKYDLAKVYYQESPDALNNYQMSASWLSPVETIRNPYFGSQDPKHGDQGLGIGSIRETLDYMPVDSTSKQETGK